MTPAMWGTLVVKLALIAAAAWVCATMADRIVRRFGYLLGFIRGFRAGWQKHETKAGAKGTKPRVAYRAPKRTVIYPAIHPEAEDFPGAG